MKKILIACSLFLALGSVSNTSVFAQDAKTRSADMKKSEQINKERFLVVVQQYQKADDKQVEQKYLDQILKNMQSSMASSKLAIETLKSNQDNNKAEIAMKQHQAQAELYNKFISSTRNDNIEKGAIIRILKEFSITL